VKLFTTHCFLTLACYSAVVSKKSRFGLDFKDGKFVITMGAVDRKRVPRGHEQKRRAGAMKDKRSKTDWRKEVD
jgi:hypothetical protein